MIFIRKQAEIPQAFLDAVAGLTSYDELQGENRRAVIELLFAEQGGLCAICERKRIRFSPTLEHFFAQSIFPHLQLDYHNLYGTCQQCNGPKAHHLLPAYIFDPRFNPYYKIFDDREGFKPVYHKIENTCKIIVPAAEIYSKKLEAVHYSAYILKACLDLMQQNRYGELDKYYGSDNSLLLNRWAVWDTLEPKIKQLPNERLLSKYISMAQQDTYPEFVSLVVFLYAKEFRRRNMTVPM
jgi:5-methylcytosine-specific restriction endonuclease McrA